MTTYQDPKPTRRLVRRITPRRAAFVPVGRSAGEAIALAPETAETIYVCGSRPEGGWRRWAFDGFAEGNGWRPGDHYYESAAAPVMRYQRDARKVAIYTASQWFGDVVTTDVAYCATAWELLGQMVARAFPYGILLATPASTGRDLFVRSITRGKEWPVLDADTQELIRSTSGQGRIETLPPPATATSWWRGEAVLPALYEYDGRLMYAALCWGLGAGVPTLDAVNEFAGYARGRYEVTLRVPSDWRETFGLVGVYEGSEGWRYPARPGEAFTTWCDGSELALAVELGWPYRIHRRLLFPDHSLQGRGPLDTWAAKLVELREASNAYARRAGIDGSRVPELLRAALRALVLHGVGAFHARPHAVTRALPIEEAAQVPADAISPRVDGDWVMWGEHRGQGWAQLAHPEWSAAIWGRARARLLRGPGHVGALNRAPGTEVVAFRTDAIYLTGPQRWPDAVEPTTGYRKAGRLRCVARFDDETEQLPWPASNAELLALRPRLSPVGER